MKNVASLHTGRHFLQIPGPTNVPDRVLFVGGELLLDHCRIRAVPPIARHEIDLKPEPSGHLMP